MKNQKGVRTVVINNSQHISLAFEKRMADVVVQAITGGNLTTVIVKFDSDIGRFFRLKEQRNFLGDPGNYGEYDKYSIFLNTESTLARLRQLFPGLEIVEPGPENNVTSLTWRASDPHRDVSWI